ncbi:MAG: AAA family ATPase [Alkalibacterium sp.]|nr:AAA family ATPase [Alkalibacterium sp.]
MSSKRIIVLVGPSGSGKTTIGEELTKKGIPKLITTTTRSPRSGEEDGVDYYFREAGDFNIDDFIEQTLYNHKVYGLTKKEVTEALSKSDCVHVSLDKNGAKAVKEAYPEEALIVYIYVPLDEMRKRMKARGDSDQKIQERLQFSKDTDELDPVEGADIILENRSVSETVARILEEVSSDDIKPQKKEV